MRDTTHGARSSPFPDDDLRRLLSHLVRFGGLLEPRLEPHEHGGVRVSMSEVFALAELAELEDPLETISQQDLADRLGLEKSTVSRLAAGMETRGWIVRERDPANRRFYRLRLTDAGRDVAERVGQDLRSHHRQILDRLTAEERQALAVGLAGLIRAMAHHHHS